MGVILNLLLRYFCIIGSVSAFPGVGWQFLPVHGGISLAALSK
jgi:hypothetical protein